MALLHFFKSVNRQHPRGKLLAKSAGMLSKEIAAFVCDFAARNKVTILSNLERRCKRTYNSKHCFADSLRARADDSVTVRVR